MQRETRFPSPRDTTSPHGAMAARSRSRKVPVMDETLDIRPMILDAQVIEPTETEDVTVVMRVTYNSLEAICGALFDNTRSAPAKQRLS